MWYRPRHVAYAVVDDTLFDVDRVIVIGDAGALTAAALVDAEVPLFEGHFPRTQIEAADGHRMHRLLELVEVVRTHLETAGWDSDQFRAARAIALRDRRT